MVSQLIKDETILFFFFFCFTHNSTDGWMGCIWKNMVCKKKPIIKWKEKESSIQSAMQKFNIKMNAHFIDNKRKKKTEICKRRNDSTKHTNWWNTFQHLNAFDFFFLFFIESFERYCVIMKIQCGTYAKKRRRKIKTNYECWSKYTFFFFCLNIKKNNRHKQITSKKIHWN